MGCSYCSQMSLYDALKKGFCPMCYYHKNKLITLELNEEKTRAICPDCKRDAALKYYKGKKK